MAKTLVFHKKWGSANFYHTNLRKKHAFFGGQRQERFRVWDAGDGVAMHNDHHRKFICLRNHRTMEPQQQNFMVIPGLRIRRNYWIFGPIKKELHAS